MLRKFPLFKAAGVCNSGVRRSCRVSKSPMNLIVFLSILAGLFVMIGIGQPLAERLRMPFSVLLALIGMVIGAGAGWFLRTELTDALNPVAISILTLPINSQVFMYVFLPTLLFHVALTLDLRRMLDDWVPILTMAVVAVLVSTLVIGAALNVFVPQPFVVCLLLGAVVATTDPSVVAGLFREVGAPERLTRLIEGESLLNDAAAIALFGFFVALILPGAAEQTMMQATWSFVVLLFGGLMTGFALAGATLTLMEVLRRHPLAQMSVSLALPYGAFIVAEQVFHVSGVIAVVASGMLLNFAGPSRLAPGNWAYLRETWELLSHWAGSLVFILAALLVPRLLGGVTLAEVGLVGVVVVAAFGARAVILFGLLGVFTRLKLSPHVSRASKLVMLWGGLRGAVTLALALAVSENPGLPDPAQRLVTVLATGFTLFTLLVQGSTLRLLMRWLRINQLSPIEAALQNQVVAVALQTVREELKDSTERHRLSKSIVRSEAKEFAKRLDIAVARAEESAEILDRDRLTLGLVTLAGRERDMVLESYRADAISVRLVDRLLADVARLIERTRVGGRTEYRATARLNMGYGRGHRLASLLHRRFRLSGMLARIVADRFEVLLVSRMLMRDLHGFVDRKILRIHGRRVADLLHDILTRREEECDRDLAGMRLQYPGHAEQVERGFIRKAQLALEERELRAAHDDGLIGPDLFAGLARRLEQRRRSAAAQPKLDLSRQKSEMVAQFALFSSLSPQRRRALTRALVTVYAEPGDVLIRRGDGADAVFFIASGAVEMDIAGQKRLIGTGEMYGELALLTGQKKRRAWVRAVTHCTLLMLDETRFRALLLRSPEIHALVLDNAKGRGIDPDLVARMIGGVVKVAE